MEIVHRNGKTYVPVTWNSAIIDHWKDEETGEFVSIIRHWPHIPELECSGIEHSRYIVNYMIRERNRDLMREAYTNAKGPLYRYGKKENWTCQDADTRDRAGEIMANIVKHIRDMKAMTQ